MNVEMSEQQEALLMYGKENYWYSRLEEGEGNRRCSRCLDLGARVARNN